MKPTIIGIGFKARQGKMKVAKAIHCAIPERSYICSFADALKAHCRVNKGMTKKDSALLQQEGERMRLEVNPAIWFNVLGHHVEEFAPDYGADFILIQDLRYPNEFEWVKQSGGLTINVVRMNEDGSRYVDPDRPADHSSEIALDSFTGWDATIIEKSGNLVGLAQKAIATFVALTGQTATTMDGESVLRDKAREVVLESKRGYGLDFTLRLRDLAEVLS